MIDPSEISKLGESFANFRPKGLTARDHYLAWESTADRIELEMYKIHCFNDAFQFLAKHADSEEDFYTLKLELDTKRWQFEREIHSTQANMTLKQIHIDQIMLKVLKIGYNIELIIQADECCRSCAKHSGKHVTLESVLKWKHLPYSSCKRTDYCNCTYQIIRKE